MITPEEKEQLFAEFIERAILLIEERFKEKWFLEFAERVMLLMPDMIERLISTKIHQKKATVEFFEKNKDLKEMFSQMPLVMSLVEQVQAENPELSNDYMKILEKATPLIRGKLQIVSKLNFDSPKKPETTAYIGDNLGEI